MAKEFLTLTRVFKDKKTGEIKKQTIHPRAATVIAFRASNRLGKNVHRGTLTLSTGQDIEVTAKYSEIKQMMKPAFGCSDFVEVTRVYKNKTSTGLKEQTVSVRTASIASVRASNRLGYPEHRSTIRLSTGNDLELASALSEVKNLLKIA